MLTLLYYIIYVRIHVPFIVQCPFRKPLYLQRFSMVHFLSVKGGRYALDDFRRFQADFISRMIATRNDKAQRVSNKVYLHVCARWWISRRYREFVKSELPSIVYTAVATGVAGVLFYICERERRTICSDFSKGLFGVPGQESTGFLSLFIRWELADVSPSFAVILAVAEDHGDTRHRG